MPTFYSGPKARITHVNFEGLGAEARRHAIADLGSVWVVQPVASHPATALRASCSGGAAVATVVALVGADLAHPLGWVCGLLVVVFASLQVRAMLRPRRHELWASGSDRRHPVLLFVTTSPAEFGQVRRALVRAIEWHASAPH